MKRFVLCLAGLVLVFGCVGQGLAVLIADWDFDNPVQIVGPFDTTIMLATFTNDASSDENLDGSLLDSAGIFNGTLLGGGNPYDFSFGSIVAELAAMNIAPGASFSFTFGTLTPNPAPVPVGTFNSPGADITIDGVTYGGFGQKTFQVTVVPEPSTYVLFAIGILGIIGMGYRQRKKAA